MEVPSLLTAYNILIIHDMVERTHGPTRFVLHSTSFRHMKVVAHCRRFTQNCRISKANRQLTILSTRSRLRSDLLREDGTTPMDRFFYCADMDTGSINQLEDIFRQQNHHHSRRNIFSNMWTCSISIQSCWPHFTRNWAFNIPTIHDMVEGTTQVITGAIKLAYHRSQ